jgi:hypothetical protein
MLRFLLVEAAQVTVRSDPNRRQFPLDSCSYSYFEPAEPSRQFSS